MEMQAGRLYFVSDRFFQKVKDPYLKINYESTKRPHYFVLYDGKTELYWLVPCSSKVDKFERLIEKKKERHKPADAIRIVRIFDRRTGAYIKGGQPVGITDPKLIGELEKTARKVIALLHRGVRFTPTQPDALRIEALMLEEKEQQER